MAYDNRQDLIQKFLDRSLTVEEMAIFKKMVAEDPSVGEEIKAHRRIQNMDLMAALEKQLPASPTQTNGRWGRIALYLGSLGLAILGIWQFSKTPEIPPSVKNQKFPILKDTLRTDSIFEGKGLKTDSFQPKFNENATFKIKFDTTKSSQKPKTYNPNIATIERDSLTRLNWLRVKSSNSANSNGGNNSEDDNWLVLLSKPEIETEKAYQALQKSIADQKAIDPRVNVAEENMYLGLIELVKKGQPRKALASFKVAAENENLENQVQTYILTAYIEIGDLATAKKLQKEKKIPLNQLPKDIRDALSR